MTEGKTHLPRRDWLASRGRLVDAAIAVFLARGLDARLDEIAAHAHLGPSTLYRHFPTRDDLSDAVMERLIERVRADALSSDSAVKEADEAFRIVFAHGCGLTEAESALFAMLAHRGPDALQLADRLIASVIAPASARARTDGSLDPRFDDLELAFLIRQIESAESAERRALLRDLILDGILSEAVATGPGGQRGEASRLESRVGNT